MPTGLAPTPLSARSSRCRSSPAGASLRSRGWRQCNGSCSRRTTTVVVVKGGRAYLAIVKSALPAAAPLGACDAVWQAAIDTYRKAYAAYDAAKATPRAYELLMAASRLETEGGTAVQQCLKDKGTSAFRGLTRQAQALADGFEIP
jgi:hypothetical protein